MIKLSELNSHNYPTNKQIDENLSILLDRLNQVREKWGKPMIVTSGLRSEQRQQELISEGKSNAIKSKHLTGQAADIYDCFGELKRWVKDNEVLMEQIGFWFEDFAYTPNWVHFQIVPPASGKRFFIP